MDSGETPPKIRKKLLKPRSQKYYSRKAKIEQALLSLETDKLEAATFQSIPSTAIMFPPTFSTNENNRSTRNLSDDHEILCIPTENPSWVATATKIEKFHLPTYITQMSAEDSLTKLSPLLNMNTWNQIPSHIRLQLSKYLPNFSGLTDSPDQELENTLSLLFSKKNIFFGNPIEQFFVNLAEKRYHPQRRSVIQNQKLIGQFTHIQFLKERNQNLIRKIIEFKSALDVEENHTYLLFPTITKQYSSSHLTSDYVYNSDTDADSGGEDSLSVRSQKDITEKLSAAVSRKEESPLQDTDTAPSILGKRSTKDRPTGRAAVQASRQFRTVGFNEESSSVVPPGPVWIFFSALRDLFVLNNFEMTLSQIEEEFNKDEEKSSCVTPTYNLQEFLLLGLSYLQTPPLVSLSTDDKKKKPSRGNSKKGTNSNSSTPSITSPSLHQLDHAAQSAKDRKQAMSEYQPGGPFVSQDPENNEMWRWVGAVDDEVIREELDTLELLFYFAVTRNQVSDCKTLVNLVTVKQQKCTSTIRKSTPEETQNFREQERERYLAPERPFCYQFREVESIVAPMKRGLGNQSKKPRHHFLLQKERPPHISLLCLVRDAAARLPGGIGTRPDVAILLCDSQYIVPDVTEAKLNTVVSGALDRLHAQEDPCVRFDSDQKLWIYLHRRRKAENFPVYKPQKKGRR